MRWQKPVPPERSAEKISNTCKFEYNCTCIIDYVFLQDINIEEGGVMNTKLTLTIDKETIGKAKYYASQKGRSLSDIVESYLKIITKEGAGQEVKITSRVKSLKGSFSAPDNFDYKKELSKGLSDKYLKG